MIIDCLKWMCTQSAANIGHLLKGIGLCVIAILAWIWIIQFKKYKDL